VDGIVAAMHRLAPLAIAASLAAAATARGESAAAPGAVPVRVLGSVAVGDNPTGLAFSADGGQALVACMDAARVDVIDVDGLAWRHDVGVDASPSSLIPRSDGSLWVGDIASDRLALLVRGGPRRWELAAGTTLRVGKHVALASARDGWGRVHVPVFTPLVFLGGDVVALDPDAGTVLGRRDVPAAPIQARVSPDRAQLACSSYLGGDLLAWDLYTDEPYGRLELGSRPAGLAYTPDGAAVLCALRGEDRVAVVDARTWTERDAITNDVGPEPIAVAVGGPFAFVLNHEAGDVSVVDLRARPLRVGQRVAVGRKPWFARAHPTRRELWVACKGSEEVHVLGWEPPGPRPATVLVLGTLGARHLVSPTWDLDGLARTVEAADADVVLVQTPAGAGVEAAWVERVRAAAAVPVVPVGDETPWRAAHVERARRRLVRDPGLRDAREERRAGDRPWQDAAPLGPAHPRAVGARLVERVRAVLADEVAGARVLAVVDVRHVERLVAALELEPTLGVEVVTPR